MIPDTVSINIQELFLPKIMYPDRSGRPASTVKKRKPRHIKVGGTILKSTCNTETSGAFLKKKRKNTIIYKAAAPLPQIKWITAGHPHTRCLIEGVSLIFFSPIFLKIDHVHNIENRRIGFKVILKTHCFMLAYHLRNYTV